MDDTPHILGTVFLLGIAHHGQSFPKSRVVPKSVANMQKQRFACSNGPLDVPSEGFSLFFLWGCHAIVIQAGFSDGDALRMDHVRRQFHLVREVLGAVRMQARRKRNAEFLNAQHGAQGGSRGDALNSGSGGSIHDVAGIRCERVVPEIGADVP